MLDIFNFDLLSKYIMYLYPTKLLLCCIRAYQLRD